MIRPTLFSETLTLDQVATMSDAEVVRRRFDRSNIRWASGLSLLSMFVAFKQVVSILIGERPTTTTLIALAIAHFLWTLAGAAFFGDLATTEVLRRKQRYYLPVHILARNFTPWVLTFVIVEFAFLLFVRHGNSSSWVGWAMTAPWMMIALRLDLTRRLALHASMLTALALSIAILGSGNRKGISEYVVVAVMNATAAAAGAFTSRRLRLKTLEEWGEKRAQAREQLRMRNELQFAREVQLSMIPESAPLLPWIELAGTSIPATEVGGDYYDYFPGDDVVTIVTGDIAGHGLASGIVLASLRAGFILLRESLGDPAAVLRRLSGLVAETSTRRMLATAAVLRIDRHARRAIVASAGHPPVIHSRAGHTTFIELFAPPLGVRLEHDVPSRSIEIETGDVFVLHSDGVYESQNADGEIFGLDRLAALVAKHGDQHAEAIRDAIIGELEAFRDGGAQRDDVTIVVARIAAGQASAGV